MVAMNILLITSLTLFYGGAFFTLILNTDTEVPINGDFEDMPIKIKIGIISVIIGGFLFAIWTLSCLYLELCKM